MDGVVTFTVKYEAGHTYDESWEKTDYFCPGCGKPHVWHETGPGDYYVGEQFLCLKCGGRFYLPGEVQTNHVRDWQTRQRLEVLRGGHG